MRMFLYLCAVGMGLPTCGALGGSSSFLDGYLPGQTNSFLFRLPAMTDLGAYNIELLLTSPTGAAGTDFYFDAGVTTPASSGYVFPTSENFFASTNVLSGNRHSLTLSDFSLTGVDVLEGANDAVAIVAFRTSPLFTGVLSLSLEEGTFQLDIPNSSGTAVPEFAAVRGAVAADVNGNLHAVPEPVGIILGMAALPLGLLRLWARDRRRPKLATCSC